MIRIAVDLPERGYEVLIEEGLIDRAGPQLRPFAREGRLLLVTDRTVWEKLGDRLQRGGDEIRLEPIVLEPGESNKSWAVLIGLVDRLLSLGIERGDHLVAFGGGVIGDLAGFAASIVNRGCGVIQIPTSLLAQVDSSVGGKTGINVDAGKNLVGAFHQPSLVLIDPSCLDELPVRQLRAGYAEIVKYALIEKRDLFEWLETNGEAVIGGGSKVRAHAIAASVAGKAAIVANDEREAHGRRALLNLGHTFGHSLEAEAGYSDEVLHGEAVAVGLVLAFDFSVVRGLCAASDAARVRAHLQGLKLPVSRQEIGVTATGTTLVGRMRHDKKKQKGRLPFILVRGIGQAFVDRDVELAEVQAFLDDHR